MSWPGHPLTPQQVRILDAVGASGGRASQIAARAGVEVDGIYPALARLVARKLLDKGKGRSPVYTRTTEGARQHEASRAYQARLREAS